ncbi:uncharacterized protein M421DRAFT_94936 [Didymella exigua CBS 183.55]|uniref:F-box domain-containing protein n=1 Tax=Didymella exigua CBS 183.55 TaxID=1150837 RepID=A0A6A5RA60_9PLEO|nr:uncharacterized protein M421DRAFT_94936 [Didymella exigua CBS 183.55]KAF1925115.1 hypothetical protein M421DRAFT_94936 [Didymella exigua CBS 183.55]
MASFFDFPPETRNSIYGLLLTNSTPCLDMLTASRLLHEEAAPYFYYNNDLAIDLTDASSPGASILPPIPDKCLSYSRVLTINLKLGYIRPCMQAQCLTGLASHCASLTILTLNFTSTASKIVSSTTDECVLDASHPFTLALQHILSSRASVRVNLNGVWFAPSLVDKLRSEGSLEVVTCESSTERAMHGQKTRDHMRDLGLDMQDLEDAGNLQPSAYDDIFSSMPSSLSSALSDLDSFSPTNYLGKDLEDVKDYEEGRESVAFTDEPMFDMVRLGEGSEEVLTKDEDFDDEEMEDIYDIEAIVDKLQKIAYQRLHEMDVSYMTNFAPNMLRKWTEESA